MRSTQSWILAFLLILPTFTFAAPATSGLAVFTSVTGKVEVRKSGKSNRVVKKNSTASEGDRIVALKDAKATLRLFDGSELRITPKTDFQLTRLTKGAKDKTLRFKLLAGKLWAKVKKLASTHSSFEIEAGGVVCGVRGTEYSVGYDPETNKVDISVLEGDVWASSGNETFNYGPGQEGHFTEGKPDEDHHDNAHHDNKDENQQEKDTKNNFNPFYGLNGTQQDTFNSSTDPVGNTNGIVDQVGDDNLSGLGANSAILVPVYPEN